MEFLFLLEFINNLVLLFIIELMKNVYFSCELCLICWVFNILNWNWIGIVILLDYVIYVLYIIFFFFNIWKIDLLYIDKILMLNYMKLKIICYKIKDVMYRKLIWCKKKIFIEFVIKCL